MLSSPVRVVEVFIKGFPALMENARIILTEVGTGLVLGIATGLRATVLMGQFDGAHKVFYPIIALTQTMPVMAIVPLLASWLGYEVTPEVILIVVTTLFPITVRPLTGFRVADPDAMGLLKATEVGRFRISYYIKLPDAMSQFFSSLKISASYVAVGTVISEWLGGFGGLDVYVTRIKKAFSFNKMFAVIFLISAIGSAPAWAVEPFQKKCMLWEANQKQK